MQTLRNILTRSRRYYVRGRDIHGGCAAYRKLRAVKYEDIHGMGCTLDNKLHVMQDRGCSYKNKVVTKIIENILLTVINRVRVLIQTNLSNSFVACWDVRSPGLTLSLFLFIYRKAGYLDCVHIILIYVTLTVFVLPELRYAQFGQRCLFLLIVCMTVINIKIIEMNFQMRWSLE